MNESPIFARTYDLLAWLIPALTKFPKDQRFRLAARIENTGFTFYERLLEATRARERRPLLLAADLELEKLRLSLRLAKDIRCLSFQQYEYAARLVNEIGKLLGGWLKKTPATPAGGSSAVRGEGHIAAGGLLEQ
jgi:hypothetical protein